MKTSELMIGDIITFKNSVQADETPIPIKVIALGYQHSDDGNEALVQIGNDETCDIVTIDEEFVGYPLTAEILEKNGFESTPAPSEWVWRHNGQEVWLDNEGNNYWANIKNGEFYFEGYIKHIHELQHALRLCGIEKEIEL